MQYPLCTSYSWWCVLIYRCFWNVGTINTDFCFLCVSLKSSCKWDFYLLCLLVVVFNFLIDDGVYYCCCCSVVKFKWLLHFVCFIDFIFVYENVPCLPERKTCNEMSTHHFPRQYAVLLFITVLTSPLFINFSVYRIYLHKI